MLSKQSRRIVNLPITDVFAIASCFSAVLVAPDTTDGIFGKLSRAQSGLRLPVLIEPEPSPAFRKDTQVASISRLLG